MKATMPFDDDTYRSHYWAAASGLASSDLSIDKSDPPLHHVERGNNIMTTKEGGLIHNQLPI
jgi:hypothetical protein